MNTKKKKRNKRMKKLRDKGFSYSEIAERIEKEYGERITRQRVHQIVTGYDPDKTLETKRLHREIKERDNYRCQWGKKCNQEKRKEGELVVHYIDFNNHNESPSNLIALCKKCHSAFHGQFHIKKDIEERLQKNPEKKKDKIKLTCQYCEKKFKVPPSEKDRKYCSQKCAIRAKKNNADRKALKMYKDIRDGMKVKDAAKKHNVSPLTVRRAVNKRVPAAFDKPKLNLQEIHLNRIKNKSVRARKKKAKKRAKKVKKLREKELTYEEISEELDISSSTARRLANS